MAVPSNFISRNGVNVISDDELNSLVQSCTTAQQLRTFTGLSNMEVLLLGIGAQNDGGGGVFYWQNGAGFVDDNYNVIVPLGSTTGAWLRGNLQTTPFSQGWSYLGSGPPASSQRLSTYVFVQPYTFPANFLGSQANALILPTADFVIAIFYAGIQIGTLTINTDGSFAYSTSGLTLSVTAGQRITFVAPVTTDATINDFAWTILAASAP